MQPHGCDMSVVADRHSKCAANHMQRAARVRFLPPVELRDRRVQREVAQREDVAALGVQRFTEQFFQARELGCYVRGEHFRHVEHDVCRGLVHSRNLAHTAWAQTGAEPVRSGSDGRP